MPVFTLCFSRINFSTESSLVYFVCRNTQFFLLCRLNRNINFVSIKAIIIVNSFTKCFKCVGIFLGKNEITYEAINFFFIVVPMYLPKIEFRRVTLNNKAELIICFSCNDSAWYLLYTCRVKPQHLIQSIILWTGSSCIVRWISKGWFL